jgi:hypothetical protein
MASTRLHVILARKSPLAVVFRRGPSKSVAVISWDTDRDEFRLGQWLKGRIYEHRCDLSPSGQELIYFVGGYRNPLRTWTAVSRPPFLKALLLWPKGDAWGGGGLFESERSILLNHRAEERKLAEGFKVPATISVAPLGKHAGRGEDEPISSMRRERDGWVLKRRGKQRENKFGAPVWIEFIENEIWQKASGSWALEMRITGLQERDGSWYLTEHRLLDQRGDVVHDLGRSDWADWSRDGDLLYAKEGCLCRVSMDERQGPALPARKLINLSGLKFEAVAAPPEAMKWGGQPVAGRLLAAE